MAGLEETAFMIISEQHFRAEATEDESWSMGRIRGVHGMTESECFGKKFAHYSNFSIQTFQFDYYWVHGRTEGDSSPTPLDVVVVDWWLTEIGRFFLRISIRIHGSMRPKRPISVRARSSRQTTTTTTQP